MKKTAIVLVAAAMIIGAVLWWIRRPIPQLSLKTMTRDAATTIYVKRKMADQLYDWKMTLNFYGKVVDENDRTVKDAAVKFIWTTTGVASGTSDAETLSDGNGLFSLTGQHGKILVVSVRKQGFYTVENGYSQTAFEYADPSSPRYYEPDPA